MRHNAPHPRIHSVDTGSYSDRDSSIATPYNDDEDNESVEKNTYTAWCVDKKRFNKENVLNNNNAIFCDKVIKKINGLLHFFDHSLFFLLTPQFF